MTQYKRLMLRSHNYTFPAAVIHVDASKWTGGHITTGPAGSSNAAHWNVDVMGHIFDVVENLGDARQVPTVVIDDSHPLHDVVSLIGNVQHDHRSLSRWKRELAKCPRWDADTRNNLQSCIDQAQADRKRGEADPIFMALIQPWLDDVSFTTAEMV